MPTPHGIYSASGISAILGLNQYKTPVHAWQEIMEQLHPGFNAEKNYIHPIYPDSAAIRWGNAFENAIIWLAEDKFNDKIIDREKLFVKTILTKHQAVGITTALNTDNIELSCHIDGAFQNIDNGLILHEGKSCNSRTYYSIKDDKKVFGDPETDQVPISYQIQTAVQRICTGADLVRLSVLIFPKTAEDFEEMGYKVEFYQVAHNDHYVILDKDNNCVNISEWAKTFAEIGNFKTYNLPSNPKLENLIIEKIKKFDADYVKTKIPPKAQEYGDVRRLLRSPQGTIIATEELKKLSVEHAEATRQLGKSGPLEKRREAIKIKIMNTLMESPKADWVTPDTKLSLIDPDGGMELASYSLKGGFRTKKAK